MTFKYFRPHRATPRRCVALPRYCAREKLADVRWMRNRAAVLPKPALACPRREKLNVPVMFPRADAVDSENLISLPFHQHVATWCS